MAGWPIYFLSNLDADGLLAISVMYWYQQKRGNNKSLNICYNFGTGSVLLLKLL